MIWQRSCSNSTFVRKSDPISSEKFSEGNLWQSDRLGDKFDILCDTLKEKRNRADSRVHFWGARQLRRPTYRLFRARNFEFYVNRIKIYLPTWSLCLFSRHPTIINHTVGGPFLHPFLQGPFFARFSVLRKKQKRDTHGFNPSVAVQRQTLDSRMLPRW